MAVKMLGIFYLVSFLATTAVCQTNDTDSLRLVSVFLRHGARTPELKDVYPNDPYKLYTFQPEGWGQLTNLGKEMAFTLGQVLRKRYNRFLGDTYTPDIVRMTSTDYDRTKMSALLTLAGLFPPSQSQKWNDKLNWMPIPYDYDKGQYDHMLKRPNAYCPTYKAELKRILESDENLAYLKSKELILNYIERYSGKPMKRLSDAFQIFQTMTAEKTMNLTLPEWTKEVYPEKITELAVRQCEMENYNVMLKKLNGGRSLQRVMKHMVDKTEGMGLPHGRKLYIYSGHENNVINVLSAMNLFKPHFPNYSSAVLIELHYLTKKQDYAVKILYLPSIYQEAQEMQMFGCDIYCPLDKFKKLTEDHIPKNYTEECGSPVNLD